MAELRPLRLQELADAIKALARRAKQSEERLEAIEGVLGESEEPTVPFSGHASVLCPYQFWPAWVSSSGSGGFFTTLRLMPNVENPPTWISGNYKRVADEGSSAVATLITTVTAINSAYPDVGSIIHIEFTGTNTNGAARYVYHPPTGIPPATMISGLANGAFTTADTWIELTDVHVMQGAIAWGLWTAPYTVTTNVTTVTTMVNVSYVVTPTTVSSPTWATGASTSSIRNGFEFAADDGDLVFAALDSDYEGNGLSVFVAFQTMCNTIAV